MAFRIGLLLFPDITQLDLTGPYEVFTKFPDAEVRLIAKSLEPVRANGGMRILPDTVMAECPQLDLICVPGGAGMNALLNDAETLAFLRQQAAAARYITSVCTGALVLGAAGLLRGKRAATHWMSREMLAHFGAIPQADRVVQDGNIITGGGVTAGIDFALTVAAEAFGADVAKSIQLAIEYDPKPPYDVFNGISFWAAVAVTLVAGLMRGFAGFGSAMLMAPIFAILFGSADMVMTIVAIEMVVSLQLFPQVRRDADWQLLTPMSIAACAAMPLGVWLLASIDKTAIITAVSAVIVAFVVLMWTGWRYSGPRSPIATITVGAISGAMMATTSVGGPPVLLYLLSGNDPPRVNRANIVTYYFLTQFLLIVIVMASGVAGVSALIRAAILFPIMLLGAWIGGRAFHGMGSENLYRQIALSILFATGMFGLLRGLFGS